MNTFCSTQEAFQRRAHALEILPVGSNACRHSLFFATVDSSRGSADRTAYIKDYKRAAAGLESEVAEVRSLPCIQQCTEHLTQCVLSRTDVGLLSVYRFVADRLRAIKKDITMANMPVSAPRESTLILRTMIRFYVIVGDLLQGAPADQFDVHNHDKLVVDCAAALLEVCTREFAAFVASKSSLISLEGEKKQDQLRRPNLSLPELCDSLRCCLLLRLVEPPSTLGPVLHMLRVATKLTLGTEAGSGRQRGAGEEKSGAEEVALIAYSSYHSMNYARYLSLMEKHSYTPAASIGTKETKTKVLMICLLRRHALMLQQAGLQRINASYMKGELPMIVLNRLLRISPAYDDDSMTEAASDQENHVASFCSLHGIATGKGSKSGMAVVMIKSKSFEAPTYTNLQNHLIRWKQFTSVCASHIFASSISEASKRCVGDATKEDSDSKSKEKYSKKSVSESKKIVFGGNKISLSTDFEALRQILQRNSDKDKSRLDSLWYPPAQLSVWVVADDEFAAPSF